MPWLIREIKQREGRVDLQEVKLGLLSAHHADGLQGGLQLVVHRVRREFSLVFHSICQVGSFRLQGVWRTVCEESADSPFITDGA
jgi:hypothetical protein